MINLTKILGILVLLFAFSFGAEQKRIAIIGSGAGGSSAAYFLKETFGDNVDITVFEKSSEVEE